MTSQNLNKTAGLRSVCFSCYTERQV